MNGRYRPPGQKVRTPEGKVATVERSYAGIGIITVRVKGETRIREYGHDELKTWSAT